MESKLLTKIKLFENSQENIVKKEKLDFESITLFNNKLYLFGSGSTKSERNGLHIIWNRKKLKKKTYPNCMKNLKNLLQFLMMN